jgi:hypothetical protein
MKIYLLRRFLFCLFCITTAHAQQSDTINPKWLHGGWDAHWIAYPGDEGNGFGVYHFRKHFSLPAKPAVFIIHVSADNRYRLFVNGKSVSTGPARSDLANWNFETVDIAPYLQAGENILVATVWNFGPYRAYAQISYQTAFIIQGDGDAEKTVNTNASWKVMADSAYTPRPISRDKLHTYVITTEGEQLDAGAYPWQFETASFDDSRWPASAVLWYSAKARTYGTDGNWMLVPRSIPQMEEKPQRFTRICRSTMTIDSLFLTGHAPVEVPAHTTVSLLIDQGVHTNAYPVLQLSGGKETAITLTYAEALFDSAGNKGNRSIVAGKLIAGISDLLLAGGQKFFIYSPLHVRTFRYMQLDITTKNEPLTLLDCYNVFTGYPFTERAGFTSSDASLQQIWQTGWRTARNCAMETYFDCPYYEQLQYVGDTRIQALISLYVSGDDRLMRKAISDIDHSRFADGLTQSRYPSRDMQVIPTFSLWWVCMIHDYWMHRKDDPFVQSFTGGIRNVLDWYQKRIAPNGMLGEVAWWPFVDWSWPWSEAERNGGVPPGAVSGGSSIITLQYAYTLQRAAQLFDAFGQPQQAVAYRSQANALLHATYTACWNAAKGLLTDKPGTSIFSQHANILAILAGAIPEKDQSQVMQRILTDTSLTQCTYYFRFYLFEALKKLQMGDRFLPLLKPWYDMLDIGLTTFAEDPEPTRSDCHAWSASPNYELLSLVCGIQPAAPGFSKVLIAPNPGKLGWIEGKMPHPKGDILLHMKQTNGKWTASVTLPDGTTGEFSWKGKRYPLKSGKQDISL